METLGPLVRRTREHKGIRAVDLAYHIGKDPSYLSRLERDLLKELPTPEVVIALARELDIPEVHLLRALGFLRGDQPLREVVHDFRLQEIIDAWPDITPQAQEHLHSLLRVPGIVVREEPQVSRMAR